MQIKQGTSLITMPEVDEKFLTEVVKRIVQTVDPEKIILFGSWAYGISNKDSDLDILVVMHSSLPRYKRSVPIYKALTGLIIPKDLLVYTPEEIEEWKDTPEAFITTILKRGKVLYEKPA